MKKKTILSIVVLLVSIMGYSQGGVGINTINPQGAFHIDGSGNNPTTGTPSAAQFSDDFIVTNDGNVGIGVYPTVKLDVDAKNANLRFRRMPALAASTSFNALVHTPDDGKVYTAIYNNIITSPSVAAGNTVTVTDNQKFPDGLLTITTNNGCGRNMVATFAFSGSSLNYRSAVARDIMGQVTIIPIPVGSSNSAAYSVKFPGVTGCGDGGGTTQFDFTILITGYTSGAANFQITNNGNVPKQYTFSILRL